MHLFFLAKTLSEVGQIRFQGHEKLVFIKQDFDTSN